MMTYHSKVKPFDIILSKHNSNITDGRQHYFVCIYSQEKDERNTLNSDIYGLIVTTNPKYAKMIDNKTNDYNVQIDIKGQKSYVCCDKMMRLELNRGTKLKDFTLTNEEIADIKENLNKFMQEIKKQVEIGE